MHLWVGLFYCALVALFSRSLLANWSAAIPGGLQDTRLFLWNAWWFRYAIDTLQIDPYYTRLLFHPFGASLIPHDFPLWNNLLTYAAQSAGQGLAGASNVWFLISWVLAGFCSYLLAWEVTRMRGPAMVAGIYVMTHSYTLARAMQNWGQFNLWGIALFLWLLIRAHRMGRIGDYLIAGAALAWTAACHYYFLIYSGALWLGFVISRIWPMTLRWVRRPEKPVLQRVLFAVALLAAGIAAWIVVQRPGEMMFQGHRISLTTPVNALWVMWLALFAWAASRFSIASEPMDLDEGRRGRRLLREGMLLAAALICLSPLLWETWKLTLQGGYPKQHVLWKTHLPGASLLSLFLPNPVHALWGSRVSEWLASRGIQPQEQAASIGWVLLLIFFWSGYRKLNPRYGGRWLAIACAATVLSMGTTLRILEWNTWMPLPFFVWRVLPVFGNVRVAERWMAVGAIAWGVVFAIALACLARRKEWRLNVLCLFVGAAVLAENWPGIPLGTVPKDNAIYQHLRRLPEGGVLPLPLYIGDSSVGAGDAPDGLLWVQLAAQIYHQKPVAGGYLGRISRSLIKKYQSDPFFGTLIRLEEGKLQAAKPMPLRDACGAMKRFKINYLLIYSPGFHPSAFEYVRRSLPMYPVNRSENLELYRLDCR